MKIVNHLRHLSLGIILLINIQCSKDPGAGAQGTGLPPGGNINKPPVAKAGPDQIVALPVNFALLDGTASTDRDNNISSYTWTKISGLASYIISNPVSVQTQVTHLTAGTYEFELKVTDAGGLEAKDTIMVVVQERFGQPVANAGPDQVITLPVNAVMLNGNASFDTNGTILSYSWTKLSGPSSGTIVNSTAVQTMITGLTEGIYRFLLTVTDIDGNQADAVVMVIVNTNDAGIYYIYNVPVLPYGELCRLLVNNIYATIPSGRPFNVYIAPTNNSGGWVLVDPNFNSPSAGIYFRVINGNLDIFQSGGIFCALYSNTYTVRIVMD